MIARTTVTDWLDRVAVGASAACLAHCLLLPLLLAGLPALSAWLDIPESFHRWILAGATPMAIMALQAGRSVHGDARPFIAALTGLTLMAAAALAWEGRWLETPVTVVGSLLLAAAHVANWRKRHRCGC